MVILAVDNNPDRLWELVKTIRLVFPNDTVEYTHDSLLAGKFCVNYHVDMIFTELHMRRMDGEELINLVRKKIPAVKAFFIIGEEDDEGWLYENDDCTVIGRPITEESLRNVTASVRGILGGYTR